MIANDLVQLMRFDLDYLGIVEVIPTVLVLAHSGVVAAVKSASVVYYAEQIIDLVVLRVSLGYHEILHIQTLDWVVHWSVLFLVSSKAFEALQRYNQYWRCLEHLNFLDGLLVPLTLVAVPLILLRKLFRPVKLPETI